MWLTDKIFKSPIYYIIRYVIHFYVCTQVLNQIQLNVVAADSFNKTWSYISHSNSVLLSITLSISLQSASVHYDIVNAIENNLRINASSVIPSEYVLTSEGFMVLAFQPNSKLYYYVNKIKYIYKLYSAKV